MKNFQFTVIRYFHKKSAYGGFTLIELLVVVIIIGILSAIALPSMLNQARRSREASALNDIGAINRSQQVYRLENAIFANQIDQLNINVPATSNGYAYTFGITNANLAEFKAAPESSDLRAFTGCATAETAENNTVTTTRIEESIIGEDAPSC